MRNVNLNRQIVHVKIGCGKKRARRHKYKCLKVKHVDHKPHGHGCVWKEQLCVQFRVTPEDSPLVLWRAVDVKASGSVKIENRSCGVIAIIATTHCGETVMETVHPKSELALSLNEIEKIEVSCESPEPHVLCYGQLRLHLVIRGIRE